ncbi:MAG: RNA polymerase sigma factor [Phenylobacterium sp.]|uniref:RNA polymerase sigma factor n=1 Tax=Phenylobacterium sp. TaxID=1871053 RepID=UPI00391A2DEB
MNPEGLDEILVRAARDGSPEAFGRLVERHQQAVRGFLRRAFGDWSLADDLAQETFIAAWERLGELREGASLRAWLCGIGYRKGLSAQRSAGRARRREADYAASRETAAAPRSEERIALEAAMAGLPVEQRAAVALCLAADFSHAEAAQALGAPLGTVKSHVARGRARLAQALGVENGRA